MIGTHANLFLRGRISVTLIGAAFVAALLPFAGMVMSWTLILLMLLWLLDSNFTAKLNLLYTNKWYWLFVMMYALVAIGWFYSDNADEASFKTLQKVVLLLLPLCFATAPLYHHRVMLLNIFLWSLTAACLVLEIRSGRAFFRSNDITHFFYDRFSYFLHPSYLAVLLSIGLVAALLSVLNAKKRLQDRIVSLSMALFFSLCVLQSSSRAGQLGLAVVWFVVGIAFLRSNKFLSWFTRVAVAAIPIITLLLSFYFSKQTRLATIRYAQQMESASPSQAESGQVRLLIWKESAGLIAAQPIFGYGTGDVSAALDQRYQASGMDNALSKHLNAHNQYLQAWLAHGVLGLLLLLILLGLGVLKSIRHKDYLALGFFLIVAFNFLFESMLERREGLFAFAFFSGLFLSSLIKGHEKSSSTKPS